MWRRVPGYKDKDATRQLAASLERRAERRQAGLIGPFDDAARRPLTEHLDDYERHLEAKGDGVDHVHRTKRRIQALFDSCGFRRTRDLSASKVATELASRRKAGLSIQTSNYYLTAIKSFCRWMVRDRRLPDNPLAHLSALNTATDEKRERRCATTEEFTTLLEVTGTAPAAARLQGRDRAILYVLAAYRLPGVGARQPDHRQFFAQG